jgi:hypothetical protein
MTTGTVLTQGTELFFLDTVTSSDTDMVKLTCPTGVTGMGGAKSEVETTCLDTVGDQTFVGGLGNPGDISAPFNFVPRDHSHQLLFDLRESGEVLKWIACLSEGTTAPTVADDQTFIAPSGRSSFRFDAFVKDVAIDISTNSIVKGTLTLKRSGPIDFTAYTPT